MQLESPLRVTPRQISQIERLVGDVGADRAAHYLRSFAGGAQLADIAPWLTQREASSLLLLLSVVAGLSQPTPAPLG